MYVDPNELIVEDEEDGSLYRVPFATKGEGVEFGDPVAVKIVYKDKPSSQQPEKQVAAWDVPTPPAGKRLVVYANRAEVAPNRRSTWPVRNDVDPWPSALVGAG